MTAAEYWAERGSKKYQADSERVLRSLAHSYQQATIRLTSSTEKIIKSFARSYGLTIDQAVHELRNPVSQAEYERLAMELAGYAGENAALKQMYMKAATRPYAERLSWFDAWNMNVDAAATRVASDTQAALTERLSGLYTESYLREMFSIQQTSGTLFPVQAPGQWLIDQAMRDPWSGRSFSETIWRNKDRLVAALDDILIKGVEQGWGTVRMADELAARMQVSYRDAERLIRTETTHIAVQAQMQAYRDANIEAYMYIAVEDDRTCETCGPLHGETFLVLGAVIGVNCPPMHPRCRCSTIAGLEENAQSGRSHGPEPMEEPEGNPLTEKAYKDWQAAQALQCELIKEREARINRLREHPELALPNAASATIADAKLEKYIFNPERKDGWAKGVAFASVLGYDINNWRELRDVIIASAALFPAEKRGEDEYGEKYEQAMIIQGANKAYGHVITGWKRLMELTWLATLYIKGVK